MNTSLQGTNSTTVRIRRRSESGQAFIEFTFVVLMLIIMLFGLIDFGRAIYEHEVLTNLSREGARLALGRGRGRRFPPGRGRSPRGSGANRGRI